MRTTSQWKLGAVAAVGLSLVLSPALAGAGALSTFSLVGGEGQAGGVAGVTLTLANDDGSAVSAGVDIAFSTDDLTFTPPVNASCVLNARIAGTHQVAGSVLPSGAVNVEIFVLGTPDPLPPLGNGPLAVCDFTIREDAEVGDMFPVEANSVFLGDALGAQLNADAVDGVITVVGAAPTPTPTDDMEDTPTPTPGTPGPDTPSPTPANECTRDADCPTGTTCQNETCQPVDCDDDSDCPPGSECEFNGAVTSGAPSGQCVPIDCESDEDCPDRSVCDENGMCRPEYCDDNEDCPGDDVCAGDGICSSTCDADAQCSPEVCVDGSCVECRDESQCPGGICVDNSCMTVETTYTLAVSPASQIGVAGTTVSVAVILNSVPAGAPADSVSNSLAADDGLTLVACEIASGVSGGSFDGIPGSTVSATLSNAAAGSVYSCSVSIAEGTLGNRDIDCSDAVVNGTAVSCGGATIEVVDEVSPTPTIEPTAQPTPTSPPATNTPTSTRTNTPRLDFDDDGCAVGPVSTNDNPLAVLMFLLAPAALLWSRRR